MAFVRWQDFMATGIAKIDSEHRQIVSLINRLGEAIQASKWQNTRIIGLRLFLEVCSHFADEEALMAAHGYCGIQAHRSLHDRATECMGRLDAVLCWSEVCGDEAVQAFNDFIACFDRDFFEADLLLVAFLAGQQDSSTPAD